MKSVSPNNPLDCAPLLKKLPAGFLDDPFTISDEELAGLSPELLAQLSKAELQRARKLAAADLTPCAQHQNGISGLDLQTNRVANGNT